MSNGKSLKDFQEWEKADLESFLSSSWANEREILEYKGSELFSDENITEGGKKKIGKTVSAFANSQGGYLFIGIEDKSLKVAPGISLKIEPSRIENILTSCTNPHYHDLEFHPINWDSDHYVMIVYVPEFTVGPLQCGYGDLKYYKRVGQSSKPQTEDIIRSLYYKGRVPDIFIELDPVDVGNRPNKDYPPSEIYKDFHLKVTISNKSHNRANGIKIKYRYKKVKMRYRYEYKEWRTKLIEDKEIIKVLPDDNSKGPLYGGDDRKVFLLRLDDPFSPVKFEAKYFYDREKSNREDYYSLVVSDNSMIIFTIFADDAPPKTKEFYLKDLIDDPLPESEVGKILANE